MHNWISLLVALAVGIAIGGGAYAFTHQSEEIGCADRYYLTTPSVSCDEYEQSSELLEKLSEKFRASAEKYVSEGKVKRMSVWVRDLETRLWAAYNQHESYTPASLMKVPIMIAYFKLAETQPGILQSQLTYARGDVLNNNSQNFVPSPILQIGTAYTVEELIEHMIIESDNNAASVLLTHLSPMVFEDVVIDLGIRVPSDEGVYDFLTVKTSANIFRILYNASYLTREYSQKALEILSRTSFPGMKKLLPPDVVAAHKFGEREFIDENQVAHRELHDCGVVYKKDRTYSFCIMLEGESFEDMLKVIEQVALLTYNEL